MAVSQSTQKWILTFFMFFNGFITPGGIIYGWPGFTQQLKDEGQYSDGCDPDTTKSCGSQDNALNNIFTVGANIATFSTIVYGFTLDRYGVRMNAFSGAVLMCVGFILIAFSTTVGEHPFDAFMPGFAMIAFGGLGTYLPAFQFSALFARPTRILSIQSALFGVAGLTFTYFKYLYTGYGISRKSCFLFYAGLVGFCGLNMLLLYPAKQYRKGDLIHLPILGWLGIQKAPSQSLDDQIVNGEDGAATGDYSPLDDGLERTSSKLNVLSHDGTTAVIEDPLENSSNSLVPTESELDIIRSEKLIRDLTPLEKEQFKNSRSIREEILNAGTILVALHFSIGLLCCNLYNANISTLLKDMGDKSGSYTDAFVFITSLYPMLFSLTIDELQKKYRYAGTSFLSTTCLIIGFAFLFINNVNAQIPAFFIFATGRALLITVMFSFVAVEYRGEHYGRVIAFVTTIAAAIGLIQIGLNKVLSGPANNDFDYFTAGMIIALTPLYYFTWWCHKNRT